VNTNSNDLSSTFKKCHPRDMLSLIEHTPRFKKGDRGAGMDGPYCSQFTMVTIQMSKKHIPADPNCTLQ
jgi:hypothetical protein